ncbi:MAG: GDSL-type esterase/lipase family protein [Paracoccus sp. (in: a-proteobacteria)]|uniref:GDSL-type esterase/lipase family protein n=1 Tax=Paracoccus sp. TaxID=267 RepID=UPI0026DF5B2A|nr:GDSL-type esterase/lipase family protein [Paracoccus sp. (in: a-proteobacteria)]MDO5630843.1 GDSL-type esterase/lipase family protein [Paracoccus sp. (in: a-proteobacteria)]
MAALPLGGAAANGAGPRIVMLGDSLTEGFGLAAGYGLVPQLERWLAQEGTAARIVNHGLSGDTTYGGRVRIGRALRGGADGVIVALGANDLLMGWSASRAEANLDAILTRAGRGGRPLLLVGIDAPIRDRARRAEWRAIWPRLAARHDTLLLPDLYAPITALPDDRRAAYLLADGVHPSAQGAALLAAHLGPSAQALLARIAARR